ncbi:unnamed protein product [Camellia sinensis]
MLEVDGAIVETDKDVKNFLFGSLDVPLVNLEMSLKNYVQEPSEEPFDIDSVPKEVKSLPLAEKKAPGKKPTGLGAAPTAPTSTVDAYEKLLSSIPEFSSFGKLFKVFYQTLLPLYILILTIVDNLLIQVFFSYKFLFPVPVFGTCGAYRG